MQAEKAARLANSIFTAPETAKLVDQSQQQHMHAMEPPAFALPPPAAASASASHNSYSASSHTTAAAAAEGIAVPPRKKSRWDT